MEGKCSIPAVPIPLRHYRVMQLLTFLLSTHGHNTADSQKDIQFNSTEK